MTKEEINRCMDSLRDLDEDLWPIVRRMLIAELGEETLRHVATMIDIHLKRERAREHVPVGDDRYFCRDPDVTKLRNIFHKTRLKGPVSVPAEVVSGVLRYTDEIAFRLFGLEK